jgi:hypothetical protein
MTRIYVRNGWETRPISDIRFTGVRDLKISTLADGSVKVEIDLHRDSRQERFKGDASVCFNNSYRVEDDTYVIPFGVVVPAIEGLSCDLLEAGAIRNGLVTEDEVRAICREDIAQRIIELAKNDEFWE